MKIAEKYDLQDGKLLVQQTHDFNPVLKKVADLRSAGKTDFGESRLVGMIPMKLWHEWAKKWGVRADDHGAMRDVIAREMNNPDNSHFRVWQGKY